MSRENFALSLTKVGNKDKDATTVYILVSAIKYFEETKDGTLINLGATSLTVQEKVKDIERQGASYGILKVVTK
jgi:hypothetical protein